MKAHAYTKEGNPVDKPSIEVESIDHACELLGCHVSQLATHFTIIANDKERYLINGE